MARPSLLALLALATPLLLAGCREEPEGPALVNIEAVVTAADYTLSVHADPGTVAAGSPVQFTVELLDPDGVDVTQDHDVRSQVAPALGVLADGDGQYRFSFVDTYTYFASVDVLGVTLVAGASVDVSAGPAEVLKIDVDKPLVEAGDTVTVEARISDRWGNPSTGDVSYSVDPITTLAGNTITPTTTGIYEVTGTLAINGATDTDGFRVEAAAPASLDISLSSYDVENGDGVLVDTIVLDQFGNEVDWDVQLTTSGPGATAWATFVRFDQEGIYTVYADIPEYALHDQDGPVLVDSTGPQIRVTTPSRGAEIPSLNGPTVLVSGSVTDPWTGVASVEINGDPATLLPNGLFEYTMVPELGLNGINVVAIDGDGNLSDHYQSFLWGDFQPVGDPLDDGIVARMNEGAIDTLETFVSDLLDTGGLFDGLTANLWTSPQWCFGWDIIAEVCGQLLVDVTNVSMGGLAFDLDPHNPNGTFPNGYLAFIADLADLAVTITLTGNFNGSALGGLVTFNESADFDALLTVDNIHVDTQLGLSVNAVNEIQVDLANTITTITNLELSFPDVGFLDVIFGSVFNFVFDLLEPLVNAILGPVIESQLPPLVEAALADLEIVQTIDLLGTPLEIAALPDFISCDDDGITLSLESSAATTPSPTAPPTIGSWMRADSVRPTYGATPDFELSLSDNWVNQLLHAVWQAGVLEFQLSSADLGLDLSSVGDFLPLSYIDIETLPLLPPVVSPGPSGGLLELGLGDMLINVYGDPGGVPGLMMQLAVTLDAEAEVTIDANNMIGFGLPGTPNVAIEFVTSEWPGVDGEIAEDLMDAVVGLITPMLTDALSGIGGIPIPEFAGLGITPSGIERETPPAFYMTVGGSLNLNLAP